jgi:hypothetical protein
MSGCYLLNREVHFKFMFDGYGNIYQTFLKGTTIFEIEQFLKSIFLVFNKKIVFISLNVDENIDFVFKKLECKIVGLCCSNGDNYCRAKHAIYSELVKVSDFRPPLDD